MYRNVTAQVVNDYCSGNADACGVVAVSNKRYGILKTNLIPSLKWFFSYREVSFIIKPSDVIITNISSNENGSVQFISYVQLPGGMQVLTGEAYRAAIEVNLNNSVLCKK